jgi:hypothetical protein
MPRGVFVGLDFETVRSTRRRALVRDIADRAGHAGPAAAAAMRAFPRLLPVVLADPTGVLANAASHAFVPIRAGSNSGLTSAPLWPQTWQVIPQLLTQPAPQRP